MSRLPLTNTVDYSSIFGQKIGSDIDDELRHLQSIFEQISVQKKAVKMSIALRKDHLLRSFEEVKKLFGNQKFVEKLDELFILHCDSINSKQSKK